MDKLKRRREYRIRRKMYKGLSAAASLVIVWRVVGLLIGNTGDAAIILGCVAIVAIARLDVVLIERGR